MSTKPRVLLISCYEMGAQPLGLASPAAFLLDEGVSVDTLDLSLHALDDDAVRKADFVGVSVPMHTALRLGLEVLKRIRLLNPRCHVCFYGLYATLNSEFLLAAGVDTVLSGEYEEALVAHVRATAPPVSGTILEKLHFPQARRDVLPSLDRYSHLEEGTGEHRLVGTVEATRGCLHHCRHCPIPPVYEGRFFVVPRENVLEDIRQLSSRGARHIHFADPDFLNGPGHALSIVRAMHREFPEMTFDFTTKIEHLLKYASAVEELSSLGGLFVISAVESLSDRVLDELDKGHHTEDVFEALSTTRNAGIVLRPTFVPFTPWTRRDDYVAILEWIFDEGLTEQVDAVQLTLRLLIPPGSWLLHSEGVKPFLGELDAPSLTYRWTHPDPKMDVLQTDATRIVEEGLGRGLSNRELMIALAELVELDAHGVPVAPPAPRLTEAWFC